MPSERRPSSPVCDRSRHQVAPARLARPSQDGRGKVAAFASSAGSPSKHDDVVPMCPDPRATAPARAPSRCRLWQYASQWRSSLRLTQWQARAHREIRSNPQDAGRLWGVQVHDSALRHGVVPEDAVQAADRPLRVEPIDEVWPHRAAAHTRGSGPSELMVAVEVGSLLRAVMARSIPPIKPLTSFVWAVTCSTSSRCTHCDPRHPSGPTKGTQCVYDVLQRRRASSSQLRRLLLPGLPSPQHMPSPTPVPAEGVPPAVHQPSTPAWAPPS